MNKLENNTIKKLKNDKFNENETISKEMRKLKKKTIKWENLKM